MRVGGPEARGVALFKRTTAGRGARWVHYGRRKWAHYKCHDTLRPLSPAKHKHKNSKPTGGHGGRESKSLSVQEPTYLGVRGTCTCQGAEQLIRLWIAFLCTHGLFQSLLRVPNGRLSVLSTHASTEALLSGMNMHMHCGQGAPSWQRPAQLVVGQVQFLRSRSGARHVGSLFGTAP